VVRGAEREAMSNIEWTDTTWNPVVGCTPVSSGCLNCYAATMARRCRGMGTGGYRDCDGAEPIVATVNGRAVFTGDLRMKLDHQPLRWRTPRRVFVCSMSDLFHESVSTDFIAQVFAVMGLTERHQYQVLTKRPHRMAEILGDPTGEFWRQVGAIMEDYATNVERLSTGELMGFDAWWQGIESRQCLPNVWLGTSVEDQAAAEERIPHLLRCPAAVRFLSCEPLLGPLDLGYWIGGECDCGRVESGRHHGACTSKQPRGRIHWVIVGGESGPKARPCDVAWIESIVGQCRAADVACFVKQLGSRPGYTSPSGDAVRRWGETRIVAADDGVRLLLRDRKGGEMSEWPEHLRVREWPREAVAS
jgi:protein gp37